MNHSNTAQSAQSPEIPLDPQKKSHQEAAGAANANAPDPRHPPRRRRSLSLLVVMGLLLMLGVGQAAWPVIDISAVAQLIQTVRLATDTLNEMTTAKDALLGQVATFTGVWDDLTGEAYELGEKASSLTTEYSLTEIRAGLANRRDAEELAWPTQADLRNAYAGEDDRVIDQILDAHQQDTVRRTAERNAWYDAQIVIAEAGQFLESIETTASTQNSETTQGLSAQLDRQIAVASSTRDIAARQLELAVSAEHRAARLDHLTAIQQAQRKRRALLLRTEMQDAIADHQADFDAAAFDRNLYTPVLPSY